MTNHIARITCSLALALIAGTGCKKKDAATDKGATATEVAKPATGSSAVAAAPAAPAASGLTSTVKLALGPEGFAGGKAKTSSADLTGPAIFFASRQPDGSFMYHVLFQSAGATATCDTKLDFAKPVTGDVALDVKGETHGDAPAAGLEITGRFEPHYNENKGQHTTGGVYPGATIKLTAVTKTTVTGEITGTTDSNSSTGLRGASGTFTALLCVWGADESGEEASDSYN